MAPRQIVASQIAASLIVASLIAVSSVNAVHGDEPAPTAEQLEFFENKIRPVLEQHCLACHSEKAERSGQLKGGLRLDSRAALLQGGDSGPAIVPGQPDDSLLLQALRYDGFEMPPKGKLADSIIADFANWIAMGAPDPRRDGTPVRRAEIDIEAGRRHWAYQLPARHSFPAVTNRQLVSGRYDAFLVERQERALLPTSPMASRAALARRLSFDLRGLPPSPEELGEFEEDASPDAYERLVDRWLAAPAFGQRWGRHWLDVARYAESITLRGFVLPEAWRYRDYVIETFQQDRPFDQFLREQIAGDLLPAATVADSQRQRVATSYLALGNTNLEEQDKQQLRMDYVDEQLDVIGKGILAQTLSCARCHDHKFDPIPTRDYYALAGIFRSTKAMEHANVSKWLDLPLPLPPEEEAELQRHEAVVKSLEARVKQLRDVVKGTPPTDKPTDGMVRLSDLPGIVLDDTQAKRVGEWKASRFTQPYIGDGYVHDLDTGKGEKTLTFQPELPQDGSYEVRLAYTPAGNRTTAAPVTVFSADGETIVRVDQRATPPIDGLWVSLGVHRFEANGQGFVMVSNESTRGHVIVDAVQFLPIGSANGAASGAANRKATGPMATGPMATGPMTTGPSVAPAATGTGATDTGATPVDEAKQAAQAELTSLESQLKHLQATGPRRPMYLSIREEDADEVGDTRIHIRGLVGNLGASVPRGFLRVAQYDEPPRMPERESGRRELAEWLASPRNPLPARVFANRVWSWVFGQGLVRTMDNFGTTGEVPSHPELLDELALDLIAADWSTKSLVRRLVTSRTYRLDETPTAAAAIADPENRLWSRAARRRLDAESLVDAILTLSGELDHRAGGPSLPPGLAADYGYQHVSRRRAVYWPVLRNVLPEIFEVFDFADPSLVTGRRATSTVATQALYLNNHPFILDQSRRAAQRLLDDSSLRDDGARLDRLYREALGREPSSREREAILEFLGQAAAQDSDRKAIGEEAVGEEAGKATRPSTADERRVLEGRWAQVVQVLIGSLDFRYQ